jgi:hypothetical protein
MVTLPVSFGHGDIDALHAHCGDVLLFRERELYGMTALVNRYTKELRSASSWACLCWFA